jgi:GNAT superfamily N-acetyltransferase
MKLNDIYNLTESVRAFGQQIEDELNLKAFHLYDRGDDIVLDNIIVGRDNMGQGLGTKALNKLTDYADEHGRRIILTPATADGFHGTTSRNRLVKFYKRFGFVESKGRNIDYEIGAGKMYRNPR